MPVSKIILITNMPTPYRLPLWDELNKKLMLEVICISKKEKSREWDIEKRKYISFLKSYHFFFSKRDWAMHLSIPFNLFYRLMKEKPSVIVITGYDAFQYWEALLYSKVFQKKIVLWSGTTLLSGRSKNKCIIALKKYFIRQFDTYYTYGTEASKYIEHFGIDKDKIITGINTVNTMFYKNNTANYKSNTNIINFLFVGRLIDIKGLQHIIPILAKINYKNWFLTIVGSGEYLNTLKNLVLQYKLENYISFEGNKNKEEILDYYIKSDVLVMPSYQEVWGLVINEALASGLFCLASKYAGATYDLIKEGENGLIIDPKNELDLLEKINYIFNIEFSKEKIRNSFTVSIFDEANKLNSAIQKAKI